MPIAAVGTLATACAEPVVTGLRISVGTARQSRPQSPGLRCQLHRLPRISFVGLTSAPRLISDWIVAVWLASCRRTYLPIAPRSVRATAGPPAYVWLVPLVWQTLGTFP